MSGRKLVIGVFCPINHIQLIIITRSTLQYQANSLDRNNYTLKIIYSLFSTEKIIRSFWRTEITVRPDTASDRPNITRLYQLCRQNWKVSPGKIWISDLSLNSVRYSLQWLVPTFCGSDLCLYIPILVHLIKSKDLQVAYRFRKTQYTR